MVSIYHVTRETMLLRTRLRRVLGCAFVILIVATSMQGLPMITPMEHESETRARVKAYYINLRNRTDRRWSIERS